MRHTGKDLRELVNALNCFSSKCNLNLCFSLSKVNTNYAVVCNGKPIVVGCFSECYKAVNAMYATYLIYEDVW